MFLQIIAKIILKLIGWKLIDKFPNTPKQVIIIAPHTSNWDFLLALAFIFGLNLNVFWIGKHTLFKNGLSKIMRKLGGIPVDRNNPELLVQTIADYSKNNEGVLIVVTPEGTRKKVTKCI